MTEKLELALVGYGYWGSKHARVLSGLPGVALHIVERDPARRFQARADHPAVRLAADLEEVIDRVDGVVVATPPQTHRPLGLLALGAGLPCLIEKPLAPSRREAEELVVAAESTGAVLMVGHTFEYNSAVWALRDVVESGELGEILYLDGARLSLGRYQDDCNVIWDLAPHDISIITYLLDELPSEVDVWAQRNIGTIHADVAYLRMTFPRAGITAQVHVSWHDPQKVRRLTVGGDRKFAVYNDGAAERVKVYDVGVDPVVDTHVSSAGLSYRSGPTVAREFDFVEPLRVQDAHFVACVRSGERPHTDGRRGLDIVSVLEATDRAIADGAPASVQASAVGNRSDRPRVPVSVGVE